MEKKGIAFVEKSTVPTVKRGSGSIHYALGLCSSWGHRKYFASVRKNGFHQISRNSGGYGSEVSPDIEVEERLGIPARRLSQAYLKINHEVPPDEDEGFRMATTVPRFEYYRKSVEKCQACHTCKVKEYI